MPDNTTQQNPLSTGGPQPVRRVDPHAVTGFRARAGVAASALSLLIGVVVAAPTSPAAASTQHRDIAAVQPLTNLAHLDFLQADVAPPDQPGHTTYLLTDQPQVGVLWTYADRQSDGSYKRIGGGPYDATSNTYSQGAFNADDVSRAAVVYLRHWRQTGADSSRTRAIALLRGLTYLQTSSGPDAGNVVLWMQPDGTLNPSPTPKETPDPSDSAESYWLARTIWALGEGYADLHRSPDPADQAFAAFLRSRMDLSVAALRRETLSRYGTYLQIDGRRTPAWLIVQGADASAEAVLGLSAYVEATGDDAATTALRQLSGGIAMMAAGDVRRWPHGAVLPWALSRSDWHAWASQMPAALARSSQTLHDSSLLRVAQRDSGTFDPWLLTSGGPDNGRLPTRLDAAQIAYGVDSRLQSLLATADVSGSRGALRLAAVVASWYFGANPSGLPAYDAATGRTVDGISPEGVPNLNGGAESTMHGLLSMLALDAHPAVVRELRSHLDGRDGEATVQAEDGVLAAGAHAVVLSDGWTGESKFGGTGYVALPSGGGVTVDLGASTGPRLVSAVVDLQPGSSAVTTFRAGDRVLGVVRSGAVGPQGNSPAPGALVPIALRAVLRPGEQVVTATTVAAGTDEARLDALTVEAVVSTVTLSGDLASSPGRGLVLVRNGSSVAEQRVVTVPGTGAVHIESYNGLGRAVRTSTVPGTAATVRVRLVPGGFAIARR